MVDISLSNIKPVDMKISDQSFFKPVCRFKAGPLKKDGDAGNAVKGCQNFRGGIGGAVVNHKNRQVELPGFADDLAYLPTVVVDRDDYGGGMGLREEV
jgi:hypothetical protein